MVSARHHPGHPPPRILEVGGSQVSEILGRGRARECRWSAASFRLLAHQVLLLWLVMKPHEASLAKRPLRVNLASLFFPVDFEGLGI